MYVQGIRAALIAAVALGSIAGCASPTSEDEVARSEDALTALPASGNFTIVSKPSSGSYVARLTLSANKKFEIEYVRRTTTMEPWVWNPWITVPVTHEEAVVLRGTYSTFAGDHGATLASFDVMDGTADDDHFIFEIATAPNTLKLTTTDDRTFELRSTLITPNTTDKRVIHCDGYKIKAVITLDEAQRRRGTIVMTRKPGADDNSPPDGAKATVVYTGRTGVDDYMAYEGRDSAGNGYDFALRESDLVRTSGAISNVGLGYSPDHWLSGGAMHNSLTCTIGTN